MSLHEFFADAEKERIRGAVASAERATTAEILVSVRRIAGSYRHADYVGGLVLALAALCLFLYYPEPFDYTYFPLEQIAAFVAGAVLTSAIKPLRRILCGKKALDRAVGIAARAAFVELRVGKTKARNGVLVFVSTFERAVEIVCDVGIDEEALGVAWVDAKKKIERAVGRDEDPEAFAMAIEALGATLAAQFPPHADDVNELVDHAFEDEDEDEDPDEDEDEDEDRA